MSPIGMKTNIKMFTMPIGKNDDRIISLLMILQSCLQSPIQDLFLKVYLLTVKTKIKKGKKGLRQKKYFLLWAYVERRRKKETKL